MIFSDRHAAGRALAAQLRRYAGRETLVLALPRGGVPVGFEIARALGSPLDVFLVRKLGVPAQPEWAMGAIASGGIRILNADVLREARIDDETLARVAADEERELERRVRLYRGGREDPAIRGKTVIVVDDGAATGASMHAAVRAIRTFAPGRIVIALPVAAPDVYASLKAAADDIVCVARPHQLGGVGRWYEDFAETTDAEVRDLLATQ